MRTWRLNYLSKPVLRLFILFQISQNRNRCTVTFYTQDESLLRSFAQLFSERTTKIQIYLTQFPCGKTGLNLTFDAAEIVATPSMFGNRNNFFSELRLFFDSNLNRSPFPCHFLKAKSNPATAGRQKP